MLDNGIDLYAPDHRELCGLVRRHLDYFQFMLGYDAGLREVITLVQGARLADRESSADHVGAGSPDRITGPRMFMPRRRGAGRKGS
jgi:hypothetical protein